MAWQDWVFSVGMWIFIIALFPSIRGKDKPALSTSSITSIILYIFALTYLSLSLWVSTIFAFFSATAWLILALQKYHQTTK